MTTATMNQNKVTSLESFISNYKYKLLNNVPRTYNFKLTTGQLKAFLNSSDFIMWCELLYGDKEFQYGDEYYVPYLIEGNSKLRGTHIVCFDDFKEFIEFKFGNIKSNKNSVPYDGNIIDINLDKVKFEESQVSQKFLLSIFPSKHEKDVDEIRKTTIKFIKYFSGLFELFAKSPYILTTDTNENNKSIDIEIIKIARIVDQELTFKRFKEICTHFYEDDSAREEFTIKELFNKWTYYSKTSIN